MPGTISDQALWLTTPLAVPAGLSNARLSFGQQYSFPVDGNGNDAGGVLEVSTDGGTTWADAGAAILAGLYTGPISAANGNPLGGRSGWVGSNGGVWTVVLVNLLPWSGQSIQFRCRLGTDLSPGAGWWHVDNAAVTFGTICP